MTNEEILDILNKTAQPYRFINILNELGDDIKNWKDDENYFINEFEFDVNEFVKSIPEFSIVQSGRSKLDPDSTNIVLYFKENDLYIATEGCYSSYSDDEYDEDWYIAKKNIVEIEYYSKTEE